ncbi:GGDEF domain-containing protein [Zavarzinia compransoris]|uniref:GGDEF domain-containing protein n=1 Tax=Zavarzinia marina TaxID=2911065 RepID=UPI001F1AA25E|nr:GGDEF domain-containing protein [Zavarzinia marina]MCF4165142.1 GGDEF domain-containing protein [Zavarzinia marina]
MTATLILTFLNPVLALLVGLGLFLLRQTNAAVRPYVRWFPKSAFAFAGGISAQLILPYGSFAASFLSAVLILCSVIFLCIGVLERFGKSVDPAFGGAVVAAPLVTILYFALEPATAGLRTVILNLTAAGMIFVTAFRLYRSGVRYLVDRILIRVLAINAVLFLMLAACPDCIDRRWLGAGTAIEPPLWGLVQLASFLGLLALTLTVTACIAHDFVAAAHRDGQHDPLSGLLNRRGLETHARLDRAGAFALIYLDIDYFKQINDVAGHAAGDLVLRDVGRMLDAMVDPPHLAARIGGEEFVILLARASEYEACLFAEHLRRTIMRHRFASLPPQHEVTASFGVAIRRGDESLLDLMDRADRALYAAKQAGRNRLRVFHTDRHPADEADRVLSG